MAKKTIKDLIFDDKNFNKGTQYGKSLMNKSLSKFGAGRSILIDKNNRIIAGNKTTEEFSEIGLENIQIVETDGKTLIAVKRNDIDLDTPEGREFALADNQTAKSNIDFDFEQLESELDESTLEEWGIEPTEVLEAEEDDFDATLPENPITVLGDLYEIGEHRLLCGDSTDSDQVAKLMNNQKSELLFTSPPYSDMREYNGDKDLSISYLIEFIPTFLPYTNFQVINLGLKRNDNEIIQYWDDYILKAKECGYKLIAWNIWNRNAPKTIAHQSYMFPLEHEWIFVFGNEIKDLSNTKKNKFIYEGNKRIDNENIVNRKLGSILTCEANMKRDEFTKQHEATFPIEFPSEYIKAMTKENNIIAEPFTGSGTTMVAAHQLKRKCYGMELDPKYCDVIVRRMLKLEPTIDLKRNGVVIDHKEFTTE